VINELKNSTINGICHQIAVVTSILCFTFIQVIAPYINIATVTVMLTVARAHVNPPPHIQDFGTIGHLSENAGNAVPCLDFDDFVVLYHCVSRQIFARGERLIMGRKILRGRIE
jgi:hypothetical protein